ncbi:MAG: hypothetical protein U0K86_04195 [Agathobacter sp.]|nr:hypothetical protein [Agathobacter sp.]
MGMNIPGVTSNVPSTSKVNSSSKSNDKSKDKEQIKNGFDETAAVYEKSDSQKVEGVIKKKDNSAIVAQLKADAEARYNQLIDIVRQSLGGQANKVFTAETGLKSLFEKVQVDADTIAQAKADIADDGYWGVEKTSDRILEFAKALSGDDPSKAEELLSAFKKGFDKATKAWGDKLPDISQKTYDAVIEKFNKWAQEE